MRPLIVAVTGDLTSDPVERQLSSATTSSLKKLRRAIRRFLRMQRWSVARWARWIIRGLAFAMVGLIAAIVDRSLIATWRERGFRAFSVAMALAIAVYARLLIDRRAPLIGKALLAFAITYGVASRDLLPDTRGVLALMDDVVVVVLASRSFMWLCPDHLVELHARRVASVVEPDSEPTSA